MKRFLIHVALFLVLLAAISLALTLLNRMFLLSTDVRSIDLNKNILVLGDSHSKYAVNDSVFIESANFSQDADSYFYTYYKLKYFLEANPQIDSVYVSFSRHNLHESIEKRWLLSPEHLATRIHLYLPLLEWSDFWFLFTEMPGETLSGFLTQIRSPFILASRGSRAFGGFEKLSQNNLKEELNALQLGELGEEYQSFEVSDLEISYLERIISHCERNNVKLFLLGTPIHRSLHDRCQELTDFRMTNYETIPFLDYRTLDLEDECFGDLVHLSPKGADYFTRLLKTNSKISP
jgi:hypothetical protein